MADDPLVHARVRNLIDAGTLPRRPPIELWGGPGSGRRCTICERPILADDLEFELEVPDVPRSLRPVLHVRCLAAWDVARS
ncbi:MAG TPA: hypothetical protein VF197_11710 [Methylomirabilota bacterium]